MKLIRTPKSIDLEISNNCNLRCLYCYHFSGSGDVGIDLPTEEWLSFFEELKQCSVFNVSLSGGEPLLRKDFKELVDGIVKNKMRFSILSNGILVNDDIAEYIKSTSRCNSYQVSIDGPGPEEHDACRGKGAFEKALTGLKCLMRHKIPVNVRVTIHKYNVGSLNEIAEFLLDEIGLSSFSTNNAAYMGLCRENKDIVQLTANEYSEAMARLLELDKRYKGRIMAAAGPLANAKNWKEMENAKQQHREYLSGYGCLSSCGGVFSQMAVLADGTMVPCNQLSHIKLGKINKDSLRDVWVNHPELKRLRERRDVPLSNFEYCRTCEYISYCKGGCPATAYALAGSENKPAPDACYRSFLCEGGRLQKEVI